MKLPVLGLAVFGCTAVSASSHSTPVSIHVQLKVVGNTLLEATLTNNGPHDIRALANSSFLGDLPTEKVSVYTDASMETKLPFEGIIFRPDYSELKNSSFQTIAAGQEFKTTFDLAQAYDLSNGGNFTVKASSSLPVSTGGDDAIDDWVPLESDPVEMTVDGPGATRSPALHEKRVKTEYCSDDRARTIAAAMHNCVRIAEGAAWSARYGSHYDFDHFFEFVDEEERSKVAAIFEKVKTACRASCDGKFTLSCNDYKGHCASASGAKIVYTRKSNTILFCDSYFSLPGRTSTCNARDQVSVAIHGITHTPGIDSTDHFGEEIIDSEQAMKDASRLEKFAHWVTAVGGCKR